MITNVMIFENYESVSGEICFVMISIVFLVFAKFLRILRER